MTDVQIETRGELGAQDAVAYWELDRVRLSTPRAMSERLDWPVEETVAVLGSLAEKQFIVGVGPEQVAIWRTNEEAAWEALVPHTAGDQLVDLLDAPHYVSPVLKNAVKAEIKARLAAQ